jgi:hypothetical protein
VEEEQIHPVPGVADAESPLPADEGEVAAELEEEGLEVLDECLLDVGLRVLVLETEELEDIGVLDLLLGGYTVIAAGARTPS